MSVPGLITIALIIAATLAAPWVAWAGRVDRSPERTAGILAGSCVGWFVLLALAGQGNAAVAVFIGGTLTCAGVGLRARWRVNRERQAGAANARAAGFPADQVAAAYQAMPASPWVVGVYWLAGYLAWGFVVIGLLVAVRPSQAVVEVTWMPWPGAPVLVWWIWLILAPVLPAAVHIGFNAVRREPLVRAWVDQRRCRRADGLRRSHS